MIQSLQISHSRDKKLLAAEAQQMLSDSKAKIEFLKMRIMKAKQSKEQMSSNGDVPNNNNNKGIYLLGSCCIKYYSIYWVKDERKFCKLTAAKKHAWSRSFLKISLLPGTSL